MMVLNLIIVALMGINSIGSNNIERVYSSRAYNKADGKYIYNEQHIET